MVLLLGVRICPVQVPVSVTVAAPAYPARSIARRKGSINLIIALHPYKHHTSLRRQINAVKSKIDINIREMII